MLLLLAVWFGWSYEEIEGVIAMLYFYNDTM